MARRKLGILLCVVVAAILSIGAANYVLLQRSLLAVRDADPRNEGIHVFVHYKYFINPNVLVYDIREVAGKASPMDVTRVLLQFADGQKEKPFKTVELAHRGEVKFLMQGDYFQTLGKEYGVQNPMYTLRTMPENLYQPDGKQAFGTWTGGMLGVLGRQMEDFTEWHRTWYINDLAHK